MPVLSWTTIVPWINGDSITAARFNIYGSNLDLLQSIVDVKEEPTSGTKHDYDFFNAGLIRHTGSSATDFTGFVPGYHGQMLDIVTAGAGVVSLYPNHTGSLAANRIITPGPITAVLTAGANLRYDAISGNWRLMHYL